MSPGEKTYPRIPFLRAIRKIPLRYDVCSPKSCERNVRAEIARIGLVLGKVSSPRFYHQAGLMSSSSFHSSPLVTIRWM